jgi:hypothetical protein
MAKILWTRICCSECPTDLREPSSHAHETGAEVARRFGAAFAIFHVAHGPGPGSAGRSDCEEMLPAHGLPRLEVLEDASLEIWEEEGGRLGCAELIPYRAIATPFNELVFPDRGAEVDLLVLGTQRLSGAGLALPAARGDEALRRVLTRALAAWPAG